MAISLENLYVIIGLKVYVCPHVDMFNYISVQGKGQSARSYLPSTDSVVSRSLKSFFFSQFPNSDSFSCIMGCSVYTDE